MNAQRVVPTPLAAWHAEHLGFLRRLELLEKQVEAFHQGERPDYEAMRDVLHYLRDFPDAVHHAREDAAFALLARKDPRMELAYARLRQEHRVIARAGQDLLELLESALDGALIARSAIEAAAATYLVYYRNHIAVEEKEVLPRAALALSLDDWAALGSATTESTEET